MDENKKENPIAEETEFPETAEEITEEASEEITAEAAAEEAAEEAEAQGDALKRELEDVRALFEKTLRSEEEKAEYGYDEAELIQSLEDIEEPVHYDSVAAEPEKECECCSKILPESEFEDGSEYCDECRRLMRRYPFRASGILMILAMIVVFVGSMTTSMSSVINLANPNDTGYEAYFTGYTAYQEKKLSTAVQSYEEYLTGRQDTDSISMTAVIHLIDAYYKMGYYPYAAELVEQYFSEAELKLPWNGKYADIVEMNEDYEITYTAISTIIQENYVGSYDYEAILAGIEALRGQTDSQGEPMYSEYVIDIYAFDLMTYTDATTEELYERIKEIDDKYKNKEYSHIPILCRHAAMQGDKATVDECFDRMMQVNCQDMNIYISLFDYYRYQENPDTASMLAICDKMAALSAELMNDCSVMNMDYLYCRAITYLLMGEGSMALEAMDELYYYANYYSSYYSGTYTVSTINLYALVALYNGNTEIYEAAKELLSRNGYEISELVENYKNGTMEIPEIIADKGGEIG